MDIAIEVTGIREDRVYEDPPALRGLRLLGIKTEKIARELGVTPGRVRQFRNTNPPTDEQLDALRYMLEDAVDEENWRLLKNQVPARQEAARRVVLEAAKDLLTIHVYGISGGPLPEDVQRRLACRYAADTQALVYAKREDGTAVICQGTVATVTDHILRHGIVEEDVDPDTNIESLPTEGDNE